MFTTTVCIVDLPFPFLVADKSRVCTRLMFAHRLSLRSRCFRFMGWGGFQIRLARRRAHPCDEQVKPLPVLFDSYMRVKVLDSILWVGPAVGRVVKRGQRWQTGDAAAKAAIRGRGGEDPARLYKYNGNLLHLSTFSLWRLSPAARISAGGKLLVCMRNWKICRRRICSVSG